MKPKEGFVSILGFDIFYKQFGRPKKGEILCLHGGPGATHDYLLPMADLAEHGYRVTFYDQLGCGRSQVPQDVSLFVPERYVEEVEALRRALGLGRPHVIGSSWGGMLAIAYALKYQRNMMSLTSVGGLHNVPLLLQRDAENETPAARRSPADYREIRSRRRLREPRVCQSCHGLLQETYLQAWGMAR